MTTSAVDQAVELAAGLMSGVVSQAATVPVAQSAGERFIQSDAFLWVLVVGAIAAVVIFKTAIRGMTSMARERTKREIAAFIAEGTMTPEQGERILKAGSHETI